jgi:hypothetical protein
MFVKILDGRFAGQERDIENGSALELVRQGRAAHIFENPAPEAPRVRLRSVGGESAFVYAMTPIANAGHPVESVEATHVDGCQVAVDTTAKPDFRKTKKTR